MWRFGRWLSPEVGFLSTLPLHYTCLQWGGALALASFTIFFPHFPVEQFFSGLSSSTFVHWIFGNLFLLLVHVTSCRLRPLFLFCRLWLCIQVHFFVFMLSVANEKCIAGKLLMTWGNMRGLFFCQEGVKKKKDPKNWRTLSVVLKCWCGVEL